VFSKAPWGIAAAKCPGFCRAAYDQGNRSDLAEIERQELVVLETFLPSLADEATTTTWVQAAIAQSGAAGPGDMGRVMGALMGAHKGEVDGGMAKNIALKLLCP
jgi:uncharacterized protein YqeY